MVKKIRPFLFYEHLSYICICIIIIVRENNKSRGTANFGMKINEPKHTTQKTQIMSNMDPIKIPGVKERTTWIPSKYWE
jgi:hypothetical protein